jgi:hypothetical protein
VPWQKLQGQRRRRRRRRRTRRLRSEDEANIIRFKVYILKRI